MSTNLAPMFGTVSGNRLMMGAKFYTQALPLRNPEAPLVQPTSGTSS